MCLQIPKLLVSFNLEKIKLMAIDGNSKSFYNSFTSRPEITFSASAKSIMEGFTYSNWYGYGKHEPEKQRYIDENGVQQKEWVQDPTNYFLSGFLYGILSLRPRNDF